jgi:hypothetical protein
MLFLPVRHQATRFTFFPLTGFCVLDIVAVLFVFALVMGRELVANLGFLGRTSVFFRINAEFLVEMGQLIHSMGKFHLRSLVEDLRGSVHVKTVCLFVVLYDLFQLSNDLLPLDLSFLEEGFGLLKVGLLSFIHSLHGFQFFFGILEALLQLTLALIALAVLLFSFSQEFPHTTH